jgi:hypothetical protein
MSFARCKSQTDRQPVRVHHCMNLLVNRLVSDSSIALCF